MSDILLENIFPQEGNNNCFVHHHEQTTSKCCIRKMIHPEDRIIITDYDFYNDLEIEKINSACILLKKCHFMGRVLMKNINSKIFIADCSFEKDLFVFQSDDNLNVTLDALNVDFKCVHIERAIAETITFNKCNFTEVIIDKSIITRLEAHKCNCRYFDITINSNITTLSITYSNIEKYLNLPDTEFGNIDIKKSVIDSIYTNETLRNQIFDNNFLSICVKNKSKSTIKRIENTLLTLHKTFSHLSQYKESDRCFQLIQEIRHYLFRKSKEKSYRKWMYSLRHFVFGKLFGWGIKISNIIITSIITIVIYSCIYAYVLFIKMSRELIESAREGFTISVERFFSISDNSYSLKLLPFFEWQESVVGLIITAILTGVFIRKIIR
jgi:hypothetical protein